MRPRPLVEQSRDNRCPLNMGDGGVAISAHLGGMRAMVDQIRDFFGYRPRVGLDDKAGVVVAHKPSWFAGVGAGDDWLLAAKSLDRNQSVVLVLRYERHGQRTGVQLQHFTFRYAANELNPRVSVR